MAAPGAPNTGVPPEGGEEAPFAFEETFDKVKTKPCKVEKLGLIGLKRTKNGLVLRELLKVRDARTLDEIKDTLLEAYEELMGLDIFEAVEVVVDADEKGRKDRCNVRAEFVEKSVLRLHTGTYVQGTEGSVEASLNLTNPLGYAEQVSLTAEYGSQSTNVYSLAITKPKPAGLPLLLDFRLNQLFHSYQWTSSFSELLRGGALTLTSEDARHAVSYELGWRQLTDTSQLASHAVRQQLGDQLKSAVRYIGRHSTLDDPAYPTSGYGLRLTSEVAGLGTDPNLLRFVKNSVMGQVAFPLAGGAAFVLSGEAGLLLPWGSKWQGTTSISDRFFLGGIGSGALRGFKQKGVGPTDLRRPAPREEGEPRALRDSLGGDLVLSLLAAVNFPVPVPTLRAAGMHGQLFLNGGNILALGGTGKSLRDAWQEFSTSFRWSVGAGIVWPTRIGRLELNVAQVLTSQEHDKVKRGIQFGFTPPAY
ncbi:hypothetical protein N2152v2_005889 [Parachlorella kessleri]